MKDEEDFINEEGHDSGKKSIAFNSLSKKITVFLDQKRWSEIEEDIRSFIISKKWKNYTKSTSYIIFEENEKLVYQGLHSPLMVGTWSYIAHSQLILIELNKQESVQQFALELIHLDDRLLIMVESRGIASDKKTPWIIFYHNKTKPKQSELIEWIESSSKRSNNELGYFIAFALLLLIFFIYFSWIY